MGPSPWSSNGVQLPPQTNVKAARPGGLSVTMETCSLTCPAAASRVWLSSALHAAGATEEASHFVSRYVSTATRGRWPPRWTAPNPRAVSSGWCGAGRHGGRGLWERRLRVGGRVCGHRRLLFELFNTEPWNVDHRVLSGGDSGFRCEDLPGFVTYCLSDDQLNAPGEGSSRGGTESPEGRAPPRPRSTTDGKTAARAPASPALRHRARRRRRRRKAHGVRRGSEALPSPSWTPAGRGGSVPGRGGKRPAGRICFLAVSRSAVRPALRGPRPVFCVRRAPLKPLLLRPCPLSLTWTPSLWDRCSCLAQAPWTVGGTPASQIPDPLTSAKPLAMEGPHSRLPRVRLHVCRGPPLHPRAGDAQLEP